MTRAYLFFGAILVSCCLAIGWTLRVDSYAQKERVIKFAYVGSPDDARHLSAREFKKSVESKSNGSMRVELYYGGQLGGDRDAIEGVKLGTIEMTVAGAGIFANFVPQMGITALPFLFENFQEAWAFNDSNVNAVVTALLQKKGMIVLGFWDNGFRCVTNSKRPIQSPNDLRGLKIRTPENPIVLATMSALGASPSPLPWPELYMALQQGAFDGQENPIPTIYVNKLYEVQKHLSLTNHVYEPMPVVISQVFWKGLSENEKTIIQQSVLKSQEHNRALVSTRTTEMLVQLKANGMMVTQPNRQPFLKATSDVASQFLDAFGSQLVADVLEFIRQYREQTNGT